jgi:hypothetical protein
MQHTVRENKICQVLPSIPLHLGTTQWRKIIRPGLQRLHCRSRPDPAAAFGRTYISKLIVPRSFTLPILPYLADVGEVNVEVFKSNALARTEMSTLRAYHLSILSRSERKEATRLT